MIHGVHLGEPEHIIKKRSIDQPLRILMFYDESVYRWVQNTVKVMPLTAAVYS